jgi:hypothetical protein
MDQNDRLIKYNEAIKPIVEELKSAGFTINKDDFSHLQTKQGVVVPLKTLGIQQEADDLQYLSKKYGPLPQVAVDILSKWIPIVEFEPAQVVLISQLSRTKSKYNGDILLDVFEKTNSSLVRERIGFVLEDSKPTINLDRLEKILSNSKYGEQKSTLLRAGIKLLPNDRINPILKTEIHINFVTSLEGLKKIGGIAEKEFLKKELDKSDYTDKQKKDIRKVIEKIQTKDKN